MIENENDVFKTCFKYYKSKKPPPDMKDLIKIETNRKDPRVTQADITTKLDEKLLEGCGLDPKALTTFYTLNLNGLIFIQNPFTTAGQQYWIRECLDTFPNKPNKTNIDSEIIIDNWWKHCLSNKSDKFLRKLRWATLGFHHNWDTKVYSENNCGEFPSNLSNLCIQIAKLIGNDDYHPEAAIVNYYHMDSTLSAHTDHSEVNLEAPLISISFGQSAIFLIGGKDKTTKPTPILLRSGDIVIMTKESRLCYHAVPRILPSSETPWRNDNGESDWKYFDDYVSENRINLNVRQVL